MNYGRAPLGIEEGWRIAHRLAHDVGPRVAGTDAERQARSIIVEEFLALELEVKQQLFQFIGWHAGSPAHVECRLPDGSIQRFTAHHLGYTQSTRGVSGLLRLAGIIQLVDGLIEWPRLAITDGTDVVAYIAVFPGGASRPFARPERHALLPVPTLIVGEDEFGAIYEAVVNGADIVATAEAAGALQVGLQSANIIIDLPGENPDELVIVSAHYDSVPNTPGAGDNASGVGGCLALAHRFLNRKRARTLRFAFWGAHEVGLLGSQAYVLELAEHQRLGNVTAAVALDILSDGDRLGVWTGGPQLTKDFSHLINTASQPYPVESYSRLRGETDSWSFAERGIDTAMLLTLPYSRFHLPEDTIENNDPDLFRFSVEVADQLVCHLMNRPLSS